MKGESFHQPRSICACGAKLDGATQVTENRPDESPGPGPGDYTVCMYCGRILRYGEELELHELTPTELGMVEVSEPSLYALLRKLQKEVPGLAVSIKRSLDN